MKNAKNTARGYLTILRQVCNHIPVFLVSKVAREYGVDRQARRFDPWSHVVSLLYAQLSHAFGLNDVCDALRLNSGALSAIRGARVPARNTFSHANTTRDPAMMEGLFWNVLETLSSQQPRFGTPGHKGLLRRFKMKIYAVDSTTIPLIAKCMDWAAHRRRKAAAKLHLRLDLQSFLPSFAVVDVARHHDSVKAIEVCAGLSAGEIAVFDKAYVDFEHLCALDQKGVFWVTRAKDNMNYTVVEKRPVKGRILKDEIVALIGRSGQNGEFVRRVQAVVEVDGQEVSMTFLTNNLDWAASSVCDLYRSRWQIEVFFKQIKQTLKLGDFLGNSSHAVKWQVWSALLLHLLLRFLAFVSDWRHSFARLFALIRSACWKNLNLFDLLWSCGTASATSDPPFSMRCNAAEAFLPGFSHPWDSIKYNKTKNPSKNS